MLHLRTSGTLAKSMDLFESRDLQTRVTHKYQLS